jgi:hypothetical protein
VDKQHCVIELERGAGPDRNTLVTGSPVPDRPAGAEPEAGCDLNAVVEPSGIGPPAVVGVYALVLAERKGVGHLTDLPPRCGWPRDVGAEAGQKAAHVVPGALRFQPSVDQSGGRVRLWRTGDEHRSGHSLRAQPVEQYVQLVGTAKN